MHIRRRRRSSELRFRPLLPPITESPRSIVNGYLSLRNKTTSKLAKTMDSMYRRYGQLRPDSEIERLVNKYNDLDTHDGILTSSYGYEYEPEKYWKENKRKVEHKTDVHRLLKTINPPEPDILPYYDLPEEDEEDDKLLSISRYIPTVDSSHSIAGLTDAPLDLFRGPKTLYSTNTGGYSFTSDSHSLTLPTTRYYGYENPEDFYASKRQRQPVLLDKMQTSSRRPIENADDIYITRPRRDDFFGSFGLRDLRGSRPAEEVVQASERYHTSMVKLHRQINGFDNK